MKAKSSKPRPYEERLVELDKRTAADERIEHWWE